MGIDPGIAITGWGVIQVEKKIPSLVDLGVIKTNSSKIHETRLVEIYHDLNCLLDKYKPEACAVEKLFFNTNAKTAMLVGQARGVVILTIALHKIEIFSYTPLQVKMALVGYGRADKNQVQEMVKQTLKLKAIPKPDDASDAVAASLTHHYSHSFTTLTRK